MSEFGFVTCGGFSGINAALEPQLRERFSELGADHFDVPQWLRGTRRRAVLAVGAAAAEFGPRAVRNRDALWGAVMRSSYVSRGVRQFLTSRAEERRYAFSLQTQSLFDATVPGLPSFVYTDHTALAGRPPAETAQGISERWLAREGRLYRSASVVFTMSGYVARSLEAQYGLPRERIECVGGGPNVVPPPDATSAPRIPKRILFVGRDWERKGGPELVRAFARVREQHPDATLVVAGCRPPIASEGIEIRGDVRGEALVDEFMRSSVFCMPTRHEPFGLVFVEALTFGLPVVSTRVGAVPEIVQHGETGCLVEPGEDDALAHALVALLDNPERARAFGEIGRRRMASRFTWSRAADAMAARIREFIQEPRRYQL